MGLINAKCLNCGANLSVDNNSKTGVCEHCGASYITEDVIINNITNINYNETINGVTLKRQAVLENLLTEYYYDRFHDVDNIKEYALKVQEYDLKNPLAHFVVFDNIDSGEDIRKLLNNDNLNISLKFFIDLLNVCLDDLNQDGIIKNLVKYKSQMDAHEIMTEMLNNCRKKDYQFFLNLIYNLKFSESENSNYLDELYNNTRVSKIPFLSQLKIFKSKHSDFMYNEQKFDEYTEHWMSLKEKQINDRKIMLAEKAKNEKVKASHNNNQRSKKKTLLWIGIGAAIFLILLAIIVF